MKKIIRHKGKVTCIHHKEPYPCPDCKGYKGSYWTPEELLQEETLSLNLATSQDLPYVMNS
jgi:hypothetical protein